MAAPTRILCLNIGSQSIALGDFRGEANGGLVLAAFRTRELLAEPGNDAARNAQITGSLREMMRELGLRAGAVSYAVAAQSVFARFVKLPAVEQEKIERIVAFEAQQNVPFPIEEVVWDYQLVGQRDDPELQVVLVAIKSDLLEGINAAVEQTGLRPALVDVASMALYNAFRFNYSDLGDCSLLVDLGARTTNLLFLEPGKFFSRSVPIGGSSISAALAKEFNEPVAAAEFRKRRDGFVSLGGAYAEPENPEVARVSKTIRGTMTRLHAEIMRSISHYRSQQQGSAPARVFLCGGGASIPYMREFFHEKLQLPTELFHPLRNVAVAKGVSEGEVAQSSHLLGELVGLALRSVATCPMELNLRTASLARAQDFVRRRPLLILAAACFLLGLLGWSFYYLRAASVTRAAATALGARVETMRALAQEMDAVRKSTSSSDEAGALLAAAGNDRSFWVSILQDLNARLPKEKIWITELVATSGGKPVGDLLRPTRMEDAGRPATPTPAPSSTPRGKAAARPAGPAIDGLLVRGLYLHNPRQQEVVVDYFRELTQSPWFAIDPKDQAKVMRPSTPNETEWAYPYELRLPLKIPVPLP